MPNHTFFASLLRLGLSGQVLQAVLYTVPVTQGTVVRSSIRSPDVGTSVAFAVGVGVAYIAVHVAPYGSLAAIPVTTACLKIWRAGKPELAVG